MQVISRRYAARKEYSFVLWSGFTAPQNETKLFARCAAALLSTLRSGQ